MIAGFLTGVLIYAILVLGGRIACTYFDEPYPTVTTGGVIICIGFGCAGALIGG